MCVKFWIDDPNVPTRQAQSAVQCDEYINVLEREVIRLTADIDAISKLQSKFVRIGPNPSDVTVPVLSRAEDDDTRRLTQAELDFLRVISNCQQRNMGSCSCGWDHRGMSWMRHLLAEIHKAGIVLVRSNTP